MFEVESEIFPPACSQLMGSLLSMITHHFISILIAVHIHKKINSVEDALAINFEEKTRNDHI